MGAAAWLLPRSPAVDATEHSAIIGVHPASQGRGIGAELLRPTLAEATQRGAHSFLETFRPRSLAFYERLGFARVAEFVEPTTKASYAVMYAACPLKGELPA